MLSLFFSRGICFSHPFSVQMNKQNMNQIIGQKYPAVVHFYAPECKHCAELAPVWNEISRMYYIFDNITFSTVNCDKYPSICSGFDSSTTPTIRYFEPYQKRGIPFSGERSTVGFAKWIRSNFKSNPYTAPNHLTYTTKELITNRLEQNAVLVVVDSHKKSHYNQMEIRLCEEMRNIDIFAIDPIDFPNDANEFCHGEKFCIVFSQGKDRIRYSGEINSTDLLHFIDSNIAEDL